MQRFFHILYLKDGSHVRLWHPYSCVYIRAQRQYKKFVHHWNNFPCITPLPRVSYTVHIQSWTIENKTGKYTPNKLFPSSSRVTHKEWDLRDDCTKSILSVSLYSWIPATIKVFLSRQISEYFRPIYNFCSQLIQAGVTGQNIMLAIMYSTCSKCLFP